MPTTYDSIKIKCPFYIKDKPNYIICEGVVKGSRVNLWFRSDKRKKEYIEAHCNKICNNCHIASMHEERVRQEQAKKI